jgi:hypothetical protein
MIANITKGADFGGLCRYLLHHSKSAEIIGGNVGGETPQALEAEFLAFANLNQRVRKPVNHISLGFAPEDGTIDPTRQERIAARIVEEMGYGNAQYLVVAHGRSDPGHDEAHEHDHLHIIANSVDFNGEWVDDFQSFRRMEAILRKIERDEGLRQIESSWEVKRNAPTHGQTQRVKREVREVAAGERETAILPVSDRLQIAIDLAGSESGTVIEFARKLAQQGIATRLKVTRTGKIQGISYQMEGVCYPGNKLYDASLPKLQSVRGLTFNRLTDCAMIADINLNPQLPENEAKPKPAILDLSDRISIDRNPDYKTLALAQFNFVDVLRIDDRRTGLSNPFSLVTNDPVLSTNTYRTWATGVLQGRDPMMSAYKIAIDSNLDISNSGFNSSLNFPNRDKIENALDHIKTMADNKSIILLCTCDSTPCHAEVIKELIIDRFAAKLKPIPVEVEVDRIVQEPIVEMFEIETTRPDMAEPTVSIPSRGR